MRDDDKAELRAELAARGWAADGTAPFGSMCLADAVLDRRELRELLELLVARRAKVFEAVDGVCLEAARQAHDDLGTAIDATQAVIARRPA